MLTRDDKVEQSVQSYVTDRLFNAPASYSHDDVEVLDAFPYNRFEDALDKTYIAMAVNFDDGGHQAELGSTLRRRLYTVTFYVFGKDTDWGKNVASVVRAAAENDLVVPLLDYGVSEPPEEIDRLIVESASRQRGFVRDPRPWEENIWTAVVKLTDEYYVSDMDGSPLTP